MPTFNRALSGASSLALALSTASAPALAEDRRKPDPGDILVTAQQQQAAIEHAPATRATVTADRIATTVNAVNVEDALKYLPSLIVRKRHIGDTQAPLATRTSGLGASARSLIYADGALLSALIGNNNTIASPRWSIVSPQEVARIDVLYGPFSAAYPGNSIGAVVNIATRLPDRLEASVNVGANIQRYKQYATNRTLPADQLGATLGDRFGPLALFASYDHVASDSQPLTFVTALRPVVPSAAGTPVVGGFDDVNRTNAAIRVLGASGFEHQVQDRAKLKAALDVTNGIQLGYVGALFLNDTDAHADTYLASTVTGLPFYAGTANSGGRTYAIAPSAFSGGTYRYDQRHWSHALTATGNGRRLDWQLVGTLYDFDHDVQRIPTVALPAARDGGAGTITRLDGTGWQTLDAKAAWRSDEAATHTISAGSHYDRFELASNRYATADWLRGGEGALALQSLGRTRTAALWVQDAWRLLPRVTLTAGVRYEWWRAYDGRNFTAGEPRTSRDQPRLSADHVSPKASLAWDVGSAWTLRGSFGEAYRFPTVAELYQVVTTPVPAIPSPDLRPERALSAELALEHHDARGTARVSLFDESIKDALISQSGLLNGVVATFVQNVDRTRARGIEAAVQRTDVVPRIDVSGSVTYAEAETRADAAFPAAVGKTLPGVPRWKATLVGTWRPTDAISLTAAGRYASRLYGSLDNSDVVGNTYQGFYKYLVVDLRAVFRVGDHYDLGLGIDNVGDDRYFLFHPFPQRSVQADLTWRL